MNNFNNVRFKQFIYLLELYNHKSIKSTARDLGITPITLDKAIKELEDLLGYPLILKSFSGIEPTPRGLQLINYISPIIKELNYLNTIYSRDKKELIVCTNNCLQPLDTLIQLRPLQDYQYLIKSVEDSLESVINGSVDIAVIVATDPMAEKLKLIAKDNSIYMEKLISLKIACYLGKSSSLSNKKVLYKEDIKNKTLLLLNQYKNDDTFLEAMNADHLKNLIYINTIFEAIPFLHSEDYIFFGSYIKNPLIDINNLKAIPYGSSKSKSNFFLIKKTKFYTEDELSFKKLLVANLKNESY